MAVEIAALALKIERNAAAINATKRDLMEIDKRGKSAGRAVAGITASFIGLSAVVQGVRRALRTVIAFDQEMNNVRAITNATTEEFGRLRDVALEMGRTTQFTAGAVAEAMTFLSRTGLEVNETIGALPGVLNLAAATAVDLGTAADISTNILKGLGMQVSELEGLVDIMAMTTNSANVNILELGQAMKQVAPVAAAAGVSVLDLSAALGRLGDAGIKDTEAGTALRNVLLNLTTGAGAAGGAIDRLGLQIREANGRFVGFASIVDQLNEKNATTADLLDLFGKRAVAAMQVLARTGGDDLRAFSAALAEAGGTAERMREQQMEGLPGVVKELSSALEGLAIAAVEQVTPALIDLGQDMRETFVDATEWIDQNRLAIGSWIDVFVKAFGLAIETMQLFFTTVVSTFRLVGDVIGNVAALIWGAFTFNFDLVQTAWSNLKTDFINDTQAIRDAITEEAAAFIALAEAIGIAAAVSTTPRAAGGKPPARAPGSMPPITVTAGGGGGGTGIPKALEKFIDDLAKSIERHIEETIGDAVFNAFEAAFSGKGFGNIFAELGRTVLAGLGAMFVDIGKALIAFGIVMTGLRAALLNLFTSGPAAIAAGAALVALGSAFTSIASGAGRGTASAGAFREPRIPVEDITTRTITLGPNTSKIAPLAPVHVTVIGPNDPRAQRDISELVRKAQRRGL